MIRTIRLAAMLAALVLAALPAVALAARPADHPGKGNGGDRAVAQVSASFTCTSVVANSSKDLSNVVVKLADGSEVKFEGLHGYSWEGSFDQQVLGVWIKSGANHSGDGPGYGQWVPSDCGDNTGDDTTGGDTTGGDTTGEDTTGDLCDPLVDPTCLDGGGAN